MIIVLVLGMIQPWAKGITKIRCLPLGMSIKRFGAERNSLESLVSCCKLAVLALERMRQEDHEFDDSLGKIRGKKSETLSVSTNQTKPKYKSL